MTSNLVHNYANSFLCCSDCSWFYKDFGDAIGDDIVMTVCRDESVSNEDIGIEMVEIYVQSWIL